MICKGCGGETSNEEGLCNICMLFGSPKEYKEQGIDIVVEQDSMMEGKRYIDSEQEETEDLDLQKIEKEETISEIIIQEFNFDNDQAEKLRIILMARGLR